MRAKVQDDLNSAVSSIVPDGNVSSSSKDAKNSLSELDSKLQNLIEKHLDRLNTLKDENETMREIRRTQDLQAYNEQTIHKIAKLRTELRKTENSELRGILGNLIEQTKEQEKLKRLIDLDLEIQKLREKGEALKLVLAGEAQSVEIAERQILAKRNLSNEERGLLEQQARLVNINQDLEAKVKSLTEVQKGFTSAIKDSFKEFIKGANSAQDVLAKLADKLADIALESALAPLERGISNSSAFQGIFSSLFGSAQGNIFSNGNLIPFAAGGVVNGPTMFPMRGRNTGLMGEAEPEAIMPLTRLSHGNLGVMAQGSGGSNIFQNSIKVEVHIENAGGDLNDPETARRLGSQVADSVNTSFYKLLDKESRNGGRLQGIGRG
jgi:hypothetical protein